MWIVAKGQKIKNVGCGGESKNFYEGEQLPDDYNPPESYIRQKIVEEADNGNDRDNPPA